MAVLWSAVLEMAEDGDITKWTPEDIAMYSEYEKAAKPFFRALVSAGWIDVRNNKIIIHDWWDTAGRYLTAKYRTRDPEKLQHIKSLYVVSPTTDKPKSDPRPTTNITNIDNKPIYVGTNKLMYVRKGFYEKIVKLYDYIDLQFEIKKMEAWCLTHETRTQRIRNWERFITNWLNKVDKPLTRPSQTQVKKPKKDCPKCRGTGHIYDDDRNFRGKCSCRT